MELITLKEIEKKLEETINPYDRIKIYNIWSDIETKHLQMKPNTSQVGKNCKKFLNNFKFNLSFGKSNVILSNILSDSSFDKPFKR